MPFVNHCILKRFSSRAQDQGVIRGRRFISQDIGQDYTGFFMLHSPSELIQWKPFAVTGRAGMQERGWIECIHLRGRPPSSHAFRIAEPARFPDDIGQCAKVRVQNSPSMAMAPFAPSPPLSNPRPARRWYPTQWRPPFFLLNLPTFTTPPATGTRAG